MRQAMNRSRQPQSHPGPSRRALPLWLRWGLLLLAAYLCFGYLTGLVSLVRVNAEIRRVEQEIAALERENARLAGQVKYMESPGYVEKVAREELGLVAPGEIRYRVAEPVAPDDPWKKDVAKRPGVEKNTNFY
ncbi:MAG: septum formation initiator family protein [Bacillota bacterium]|nr:septum formation initiator family protein [Bacillota bacterium]